MELDDEGVLHLDSSPSIEPPFDFVATAMVIGTPEERLLLTTFRMQYLEIGILLTALVRNGAQTRYRDLAPIFARLKTMNWAIKELHDLRYRLSNKKGKHGAALARSDDPIEEYLDCCFDDLRKIGHYWECVARDLRKEAARSPQVRKNSLKPAADAEEMGASLLRKVQMLEAAANDRRAKWALRALSQRKSAVPAKNATSMASSNFAVGRNVKKYCKDDEQ